MVQIVIVEKNGSLKEVNIKQYDSEFLCKKAGFKNSNGFKAHTCWKQENMEVYLYGKTEGRAGQENKYDMPPPSDNTLFFGSCLLLMKKKSKEVDLTVKSWKEIYESLFGGFEDVGDEDSEEDAEEGTDTILDTEEDSDCPEVPIDELAELMGGLTVSEDQFSKKNGVETTVSDEEDDDEDAIEGQDDEDL